MSKFILILFAVISTASYADSDLTGVGNIVFGTDSNFHYITTEPDNYIEIQTTSLNVTTTSSFGVTAGIISMAATDFSVYSEGLVFLSGESAVAWTQHGLQLQQSDSKPTCSSGYRGTVYYENGGDGVADVLYVCMKDASDNYAWVAK